MELLVLITPFHDTRSAGRANSKPAGTAYDRRSEVAPIGWTTKSKERNSIRQQNRNERIWNRHQPDSNAIPLAGRSWRTDSGAPQALASELEVSLRTVTEETISLEAGRIAFAPDGGSSGGSIEQTGAQTRLVMGIEWLTARVAIAQMR